MQHQSQTLQGYWTVQQLAQKLRVTPRTLYRWHLRRIGPPRIVIGRLILFNEQSVRDWLASREDRKKR